MKKTIQNGTIEPYIDCTTWELVTDGGRVDFMELLRCMIPDIQAEIDKEICEKLLKLLPEDGQKNLNK